jgi:hypothetical protein
MIIKISGSLEAPVTDIPFELEMRRAAAQR